MLGYLMDFPRLNRRMHNKAFIADNQAVVVGGRNVGDEYFGATDGALFEDLDVFAIGPVVAEVSADFDRYWASRSSHQVSTILKPADPGELDRLRVGVERAAAEPLARAYARAVERTPIARAGPENALALEWTRVTMLSDDPAKGLGQAPPGGLMAERLARIIGRADRKLALVSAYFVPTAEGTKWFAGLARSGVDVSIMTNALEATDVAAVHAGYAPHRPALLGAGVTLWELKAEPGQSRVRLGLGLGSRSHARPALSASSSSLHAKTFAVDGARIFIGSFNFDPRSVSLNTELGFLIESPSLAGQLHAKLEGEVAPAAYRVRSGPAGLEWVEEGPRGRLVHRVEPGTRWHQRAMVRVMGWLPIEGLL
jgi:putative cardiolipin synthase